MHRHPTPWFFVCLVALLWSLTGTLGACKGDKKTSDSKGAAVPSSPATESAGAQGGDKAKTPVPVHDAAPGEVLAKGHKAQIDQAFEKASLKLGPAPLKDWTFEEGSEIRFFGWVPGGTHYVTVESFGHYEDLGVAPFWVRFLQVRDIHTQKVVTVFQDEPYKNSDWGKEVKPADKKEKAALTYWKKLENQEKGYAHLRTLGMLLEDKSGPSPAPEGKTISLHAEGKAPRGSELKIDELIGGFDFRWDHVTRDDADKDTDKKHYAPFMHVDLQQGEASQLLVKLRSRISFEELRDAADMRQTYLDGYIGYQWGSQGRRVVLTYYEEVHNQHEEVGTWDRSAYYIRAVGPQIKIIDAGIGEEGARKAAAAFDAAGLYVTIVEDAAKDTKGVSMYFRGEAGKASAEALAKILPASVSEELTKKGWIDLIVVLGS